MYIEISFIKRDLKPFEVFFRYRYRTFPGERLNLCRLMSLVSQEGGFGMLHSK